MADEMNEYVIDFTAEDTEPIEIEMLSDEPMEIDYTEADIIYLQERRKYQHTLSQVDIDNKYIFLSELSGLADKGSVQVFVAQCGLKLQYLQDYSITNDSKIIWDGFSAEGLLIPGDLLEIYY